MNFKTFVKLSVTVALIFTISCQEKKEAADAGAIKPDMSRFLGQWTIDIMPSQVGWLEVRQENGYIDADLLWGGGSVLPVPYIYLSGDVLYVGRAPGRYVRKKDENGNEARIHN